MGAPVLQLGPGRADAAAVRQALRDDLVAHGIDTECIEDIVLVATELVGNAVLHGSTGCDADALCIRWFVDGRGVRLRVVDGSDRLPVRRAAGAGDASGRGLAIVAALSADWGVEPDARGKAVWAQLPARITA